VEWVSVVARLQHAGVVNFSINSSNLGQGIEINTTLIESVDPGLAGGRLGPSASFDCPKLFGRRLGSFGCPCFVLGEDELGERFGRVRVLCFRIGCFAVRRNLCTSGVCDFTARGCHVFIFFTSKRDRRERRSDPQGRE